MKENLLKLAKEKGFKAKNVYPYTFPGSGIVSEYEFYLWMCELQKSNIVR